MTINLRISEIQVGQRARRVGSVDSLKKSIDEVGLLHPIVVDGSKRLIAGARRLEAVRQLGWEFVEVKVVHELSDALELLRAERAENAERVDFTPSEAVELGQRIEELERPAAKERIRDGAKRGGQASGKLPEASMPPIRDLVGAAVGMSGRTYQDAKTVVNNGIPALVEAMDSGSVAVSAAAKVARLPLRTQEEILKAGPPVVQEAATELREGVPAETVAAEVADLKARAEERKRTKLPPKNPTAEEQERTADFCCVELLTKAVMAYGLVANDGQREQTARVLFNRDVFHRHPSHRHHDHEQILRELEAMARGFVVLFDGQNSKRESA